MTMIERRERTAKVLNGLGFGDLTHLPLLEEMPFRRRGPEIINRLLALHCLVALSFDRVARLDAVTARLTREALWESLTGEEADFVRTGAGEAIWFQWKLEALFGLVWVSGIYSGSVLSEVSNDFVFLLPGIANSEPMASFYAKVVLRDDAQLLDALDILYCLDSLLVHDALLGDPAADGRGLASPSVRQRRLALEWIFTEEEWDDIELDT